MPEAIVTPEQAFLGAILAAPDDDAPRLIFADWLEENSGTVPCATCAFLKPGARLRADCPACDGSGHVSDGRRERAEFIRVQMELARLKDPHSGLGGINDTLREIHPTDPPCQCRHCVLRRRERKLQEAYELTWARPVARLLGRGDSWKFRRGFVEVISCTAGDFFTHGPALVRSAPLTSVRLTDIDPERHSLNDKTWWELHFDGYLNRGLRSAIPRPWFDMMGGQEADGSRRIGGITFESERIATEVLSKIALQWARGKHG